MSGIADHLTLGAPVLTGEVCRRRTRRARGCGATTMEVGMIIIAFLTVKAVSGTVNRLPPFSDDVPMKESAFLQGKFREDAGNA